MVVTVGFDLDLTLLESRPGIRRSLEALARDTGVFIDVDVVLGRLGPKLETELAAWFPAADVPAAAARYREFYWKYCTGSGTSLLPGARASVEAVRAAGGRVLIVTAKSEPLSLRCLDAVGMPADVLVGHVHGVEKRDALRAHDAAVYVGDTVADVRAGVDAGAIAVGVATGMHNRRELAGAGAKAVFATLEDFPDWFTAQAFS